MSMSGYTKLFSSIIHSTIWREADHIRLVWVTMLAMSDRDGFVEASTPGLADVSRVTLTQCREALAVLSSPDPDSRTPDNEGRRIAKVDGGWKLLNYAKYREKLSKENQREKTRQRVAKHRERKANSEKGVTSVGAVTQCNPIADAEADPKAEARERETRDVSFSPKREDPFMASFTGTQPGQLPEVLEIHRVWREVFGKTGATIGNPNSEYAKMLRDSARDYGLADCLAVIRYAPKDGMVSGKDDEKGKKHDDLFYILGNKRTFDRLLVASKAESSPKAKALSVSEQMRAYRERNA